MAESDAIFVAIYASIDDLNPALPPGSQLAKSLDTKLFGDESALDSLNLVNLIVGIEENVERDLGVAITIADERAMSAKQSPFRTVRSLADHISRLVEESRG